MSAFRLIRSALPLKADVAAVRRESPNLTHNGLWGSMDFVSPNA